MSTQTTQQVLDAEDAVELLFNDFSRSMASFLVVIGDQLDLFEFLHDNNYSTLTELCEISGFNERYLGEWLNGCYAAGYLKYDPETEEYSIPDAMYNVLGNEESPYFLQGIFNQMFPLWFVLDEIMERFTSGGGVAYDAYDDRWWEGIERETMVTFKHALPSYIERMPSIHEKLTEGAEVADIGCGHGRALIEMAKLYPNSQFYGLDLHQPSLDIAKQNAEEEGVANNINFEKIDVGEDIPGNFDMVTAFDVVHDLEDPEQVFKNVYNSLKDGGVFFFRDFNPSSDLDENKGNFPTALYTFSLMYCMTTALTKNNKSVGTMGLTQEVVNKFSETAGFSDVDILFKEEDDWVIGYKLTK